MRAVLLQEELDGHIGKQQLLQLLSKLEISFVIVIINFYVCVV